MGLLGGFIGGMVGGLVGALVWAGISYGMGYEFALIGIAIGAMVGFGVGVGDRGQSGSIAGILAALITIGAILGGKYLAVEFILSKGLSEAELKEIGEEAVNDHELVLSFIADEIVTERQEAGGTIAWPPGADSEYPSTRADYPVDIWLEAGSRWTRMSHQEQVEFRQFVRESVMDGVQTYLRESRDEAARFGFMHSFSPVDAIFFLIAISVAFKVAVGFGRADEPRA